MTTGRKSVFFLAAGFIVLAAVLAGAAGIPRYLNFQGKLTDDAGQAKDGEFSFVFRLCTDADGTTSVWTETHGSVNVSDGLYSVVLGTVTALTGVNFNQPLWLEVKVEGNTLLPRYMLTASPYALAVGTMTAGISMGNNKIHNLDEPDLDADAATKKYVDDTVVAGGDGLGDHEASEKLKMNGFQIVNCSSLTITGANVILKATAAYAVNGDDLGSHKAKEKLNMNGNQIVNCSSITITGANVILKATAAYALSGTGDNLGSHSAEEKLKMNGHQIVNCSSITITGANVILKATAAYALNGDDMGNHRAKEKLNMAGFQIVNCSSLTITGANIIIKATAAYSQNAGLLDGLDSADYLRKDGSIALTGDLDAGSNYITNLATVTFTNNVSMTTDGAIGLVISSTLTVKGVVVGSTFVATGADIAEIFPSSEKLEAGDVVCISRDEDEEIVLSRKPYDTAVAGIVSTSPGYVLNGSQKGYKLALAGRVPVKVCDENGSIGRGDLLTTSSRPGFAMKADENKPGAIVGKAMEKLKGSEGRIIAIITLQ
ncbi:MAG: hypothetical protein JXJ19_08520 [Elusimicrobia bacterium]|nr:hypothetical protein [Elusimicrobiota bacterium]